MLENASSEGEVWIIVHVFSYNLETRKVVIDTEMRIQMQIFLSILCLNDLQRNKGNQSIVQQQPSKAKKREIKDGLISELKIIDFRIIVYI